VVPTILNAVGLSGKGLDGDSLIPTLQSGADAGRPILQEMFLPEYITRGKDPFYRVAVRSRDLVLHRRGAVYTLFNYIEDPGEDVNLASKRVDVADDLAELMQDMTEAGRLAGGRSGRR